MACEEHCCGWTLWVIVSIGFFLMLVFGSIIVYDVNQVDEYDKAQCSAFGKTPHIDGQPTCAQGTVTGCILDSNSTCIQDVELFYPPVQHWRVICYDKMDVRAWAIATTSKTTVPCYHRSGLAVTTKLSKAEQRGWNAMLWIGVFGILSNIILCVCFTLQ